MSAFEISAEAPPAKFWQELLTIAMQRNKMKSFKIPTAEFQRCMEANRQSDTAIIMMFTAENIEIKVTSKKERDDLYKLFMHNHEGAKPT